MPDTFGIFLHRRCRHLDSFSLLFPLGQVPCRCQLYEATPAAPVSSISTRSRSQLILTATILPKASAQPPLFRSPVFNKRHSDYDKRLQAWDFPKGRVTLKCHSRSLDLTELLGMVCLYHWNRHFRYVTLPRIPIRHSRIPKFTVPESPVHYSPNIAPSGSSRSIY